MFCSPQRKLGHNTTPLQQESRSVRNTLIRMHCTSFKRLRRRRAAASCRLCATRDLGARRHQQRQRLLGHLHGHPVGVRSNARRRSSRRCRDLQRWNAFGDDGCSFTCVIRCSHACHRHTRWRRHSERPRCIRSPPRQCTSPNSRRRPPGTSRVPTAALLPVVSKRQRRRAGTAWSEPTRHTTTALQEGGLASSLSSTSPRRGLS